MNKKTKVILLVGVFYLFLSSYAYPIGKSFQPSQSDSIILELPKGFSLLSNEIREINRDGVSKADELKGMVQQLLRIVDITGDEQYLGIAQSILNAYENENELGQDLKISKAKILQKQHKFDEALALLEQVIQANSNHAEAHLVTAYIYFAIGQAEQAIEHCYEVEQYYGSVISLSCTIKAKAHLGDTNNSVKTLEAISELPSISEYERREVLLTLSEVLLMQGEYQFAKKHLSALLLTNEDDHYVQLQLADLNSFLGDFKANIDSLKNSNSKSLQLRLALSQLKLNGNIDSKLKNGILNYFEQQLLRGNNLASADYGEFLYSIENNYKKAYFIALNNWRNQRGLNDTELLIRTAIKANEVEALQEVKQWINTSNLKDKRISDLLASAENLQ